MHDPRFSDPPVGPKPRAVAAEGARRSIGRGIADPAEARDLGVPAALALVDVDGPVEVYVDLGNQAVRVALRGNRGIGVPWHVAGPLLRQRVLAAVGPLLAAGWRLEGTFPAAARWDVSVATGPDLYRGCWVRMRRGDG